ncbi:hypothetical protein [uncultured Nitratireductor sp.]|uniref:hypothetical protein n=1 Tax=uncultured Nitratireductor sp. TaxID=520953 RepID=UPI0025CBE75A|nr:hypothetical protein [uncultured Nitratireductor sp.]
MAVHLKDRLRDMRDFLRAHRYERRATASTDKHFGDIEKLLGRAVSVVDDTLTLAESASRTVLPDRRNHELVLRPLTGYFTDFTEGERAFRRHMYRAAKALADTLQERDPPHIRETAFAGAYETLRQRQGHIVLALKKASGHETLRPLVAGLLAHLLQEICRNALSDPATPPTAQNAVTCISVFAPGLLASALALFDDSLPAPDLLDIATLAIAAREERMARSLKADQPITDLTAIFESLLTHLP